MYICLCRAVTDEDIKDSVKSGARCFVALQRELGVSTQCGKCREDVHECLQEALVEDSSIPTNVIHLPVLVKQG